MVFFPPTEDAPAEADTRTRLPSICGAVPAALQRSAAKLESVGSTGIVRVALAVRPRESVTVTVMVLLPAVVR